MLDRLNNSDRAAVGDSVMALGEEILLHKVIDALISLEAVLVSWVNHVAAKALGQEAKHGCMKTDCCIIFVVFRIYEQVFVCESANSYLYDSPVIAVLSNNLMASIHASLHARGIVELLQGRIELNTQFVDVIDRRLVSHTVSVAVRAQTFLRWALAAFPVLIIAPGFSTPSFLSSMR